MLREEIQSIAEAHAKWLKSGGVDGKRANLSGQDLSMADLSNLDFTRGLFFGARLERANISRCVLAYAGLRDAHLGYSHLGATDFTGANLAGVLAPGSDFSRACLQQALLDGANFDGSLFVGADFSEARGRFIHFDRCNLANAIFDNAVFEDIHFTEANLSNASVKEASLWGLSLGKAIVYGVNFAEAANIEDVESGQDLLKRDADPDNVVLTPRQSRRLYRLHSKKKDLREISRKVGIPRSVVRAKMQQADIELLEKAKQRPVNAKRQLANLYMSLGTLAFVIAGCSIVLAFASGFVDFYRLSTVAGKPNIGGLWYAIWLICSVGFTGIGVFALTQRERLLQVVYSCQRMERLESDASMVSLRSPDEEPPDSAADMESVGQQTSKYREAL